LQKRRYLLCIEEHRVVQHDNTVRYKGLVLQIPKNEYRYHYIKAEVKVHEYFDHQLAIFYGPLCIGRYEANGMLKNTTGVVQETKASFSNKQKQLTTDIMINNKATSLRNNVYATI